MLDRRPMAAASTDLDAKTQSTSPPPETEPKLGFLETLKTFPRSFWMGCGIEMWERIEQ